MLKYDVADVYGFEAKLWFAHHIPTQSKSPDTGKRLIININTQDESCPVDIIHLKQNEFGIKETRQKVM